ncbi:MAG: energy transducer TonB [Deltaproteobacteria bacterium]|nr:energy transducer TonB [Deltaproteobacteria bacterium]
MKIAIVPRPAPAEPPVVEPPPPVKIAIVPRPAPAEPPVVEPPPPAPRPEAARTAPAMPDRRPEPQPQRRPPPAAQQPPPPLPEPPRPPSGGGPPPSFGIRLENTPLAAPGTGVPLPAGDTLATDPSDRGGGRGRPRSTGGPPGPSDVPLAAVQKMPKLVGDSVAEYPADVRRLGVQGRVVLELTVDEGGRVAGAKVVRNVHPRLDEAALLASRALRFAPGTLDGRPVRVRIPYSYVFVLE